MNALKLSKYFSILSTPQLKSSLVHKRHFSNSCYVILCFYVSSRLQMTISEAFHGNFLYSESFCQKAVECKPPIENIFKFFLLKISWLRLELGIYQFLSQHTTSYNTKSLIAVWTTRTKNIFKKKLFFTITSQEMNKTFDKKLRQIS